MQLSENFDFFASIQQRLLREKPNAIRLKSAEILGSTARAVLLIGPRGSGKTNILLEKIRLERERKLLYISADHPRLRGTSLMEFAEQAFIFGYDGLLIDEVHYYRDWPQDLKALYDSHPKKVIWASDSSSGVLRDGGYDLSRRYLKLDVPLLSLREYVHLKTGRIVDPFDPFKADPKVFAEALSIDGVSLLSLFRSYLAEGLRPIFLEGDYSQKIVAILDKTLHSDIPYLVQDLRDSHLMVMSAIIRALTLNPIPTINLESMCSEWGIGREKIYALLTAMETIGLISVIKKKSDHKAYSKGSKIFMADPSVYSALGGNLSSRREAFVCFCAKNAGRRIFASKDEKIADFEIDDFSVEVGGKTKKIKRADFVIRDDIDMPGKGVVPLWSLGMMV